MAQERCRALGSSVQSVPVCSSIRLPLQAMTIQTVEFGSRDFFCLSVYLSVTGFPHTCVLSSYGHMELHVSKSPEDTTTKNCKMYPESIYWDTTNKPYARGKRFSCNKYRRLNNNITIALSKPLKFTELLGLEIRGQIRLLSWLLLFQILILTTESS